MRLPFRLTLATLLLPSGALAQALPRVGPPAAIGTPALFGAITHVAVAPDGAVLVGDQENARLYRFRPDGTLRDSLGRKGDGPGEFRALAGVALGPAGEAALVDIMTRRVTTWRADGTLQPQATITDGTPLAMLGWRGGPVVTVTDFAKEFRFVRVAAPTAPTAIATIANGDLPVPMCQMCPFTALADGRLLVGATTDSTWRVMEFDERGRPLRQWTRPAERPRRRTDAELANLMTRMQGGPRGGTGSPEGRPTAPDAERFRYQPRIAGIEQDGTGRVWVQARHAIPGATHFDLFTPTGRFLGVITLREASDGFAIAGDHLVTWGVNDDGESILRRYRIGG